jgi:hypothetical protein
LRRTGRVDANQGEIVEALRRAGRHVLLLSSVGKGCPDLLVSWSGRAILMEVKTPGGRLTPDQEAFVARYPGPFVVVRSAAEALAATGVVVHCAA